MSWKMIEDDPNFSPDAMLPEIHGFEICQKIKQSQQYRHIPVIIISAIYTGWNFVQDVKRSDYCRDGASEVH